MNRNILITSALLYANGYCHLGHIAGAFLPADLFARFHRMKGNSVLFVSGSDEYGAAITMAAEKQQTTPNEIVNLYHNENKDALLTFGMSFDIYDRTTNPIHTKTAQEFFLSFYSKGFLSVKEEEQFYDASASMFLPDRYVEGICPNCAYDKARGDQCERCGAYYNQTDLKEPKSLISGTTPVPKTTKHWYFRYDLFQKFLEEYIQDKSSQWKENVLQQTRSWLQSGLSERAITRDLDWGIPLPLNDTDGKAMYVWFEAVFGYISATKQWAETHNSSWEQWWKNPATEYYAFIGKDNIVFHTLMFPAMLSALQDGYILPTNVPANEFMNLEGRKFSKSANWGIDLREFLQQFPQEEYRDSLRYTIAMNFPETRDSDFTWTNFQARVNNELSAILGNFINRTLTFTDKSFDSAVPTLENFETIATSWNSVIQSLQNNIELTDSIRVNFDEVDLAVLSSLFEHHKKATEYFEQCKFRDAIVELMSMARAANKYFNDAEPWKTIKTDKNIAGKTILNCLQIVKILGIVFEPILPFTCKRIQNSFSDNTDNNWNNALQFTLAKDTTIINSGILFTKIEDALIEELKKQLEQKSIIEPVKQQPISVDKKQKESQKIEGVITIDDFKKVQLRTAQIISAEAVPKSKKLLKLQVSFGEEQRQILAGIAQMYTPEELIGKVIVVVYNLAPATLMSETSNGMLLAANSAEGTLSIVTIDMKNGALLNAEVR
ncbi:MAG: methionine--tRNA ligase [Candidatus Kapabacteria bacterium]|nr:methionine--tRNA ligase [Candidatus Kapabacteria bacterium]